MREPARKLKRSHHKNICRFSSSKSGSGTSILTESILEKNFCHYLEFSSSVRVYNPQVETLILAFDDGSSHKYTPDFEVIFTDSTRFYIEVKPFVFAKSEYFQEVFSQTEKVLSGRGIQFQLFTEEFICREPLLRNLKKLHRYRSRPVQNWGMLRSCSELFRVPVRLGQLIESLKGKVDLREIYTWAAWGYLRFDVEVEEITTNTEVTFNVP